MGLNPISFHILLFLLSQTQFNAASPEEYIEVSKPINYAANQACSIPVFEHDFGNTVGQPPVQVSYSPPANCSNNWNKVVLQWSATCNGKQYDRIAGVWLSGVEILRTSTVDSSEAGVSWEVSKDITRYSTLMNKSQNLVVMLENNVDSNNTGIFHVTINFHFLENHDAQVAQYPTPADLILPISKSSPDNGGYWFWLQNESDIQSKNLQVPSNAYRAVVEIYVSANADDEFWYLDPPDAYKQDNNLSVTGGNDAYKQDNNLSVTGGNGSFREVVSFIDGVVVSAVWPFPVVFTGGISPLFWNPVVAIGAFDLPTYDAEVTPFLGQLLDGKQHTFGFSVTNGVSTWIVDANLHLWLDEISVQTVGMLIDHQAPAFKPVLVPKFKDLLGLYQTNAERTISYSGWVNSTQGNITTHVLQYFNYSCLNTFDIGNAYESLDLKIDTIENVTVETPSESVLSQLISNSYPLYIYSSSISQDNGSLLGIKNISHAFNKAVGNVVQGSNSFGFLQNSQIAKGSVLVKGQTVLSSKTSNDQTYKYETSDGCYSRSVSVLDSKLIQDNSDTLCT